MKATLTFTLPEEQGEYDSGSPQTVRGSAGDDPRRSTGRLR